MNTYAPFELVIGQFVKSRHIVDLAVIAMQEQQILMAGEEHVRQLQQGMRMPALFQYLDVKLSHQRFCSGGCLDQNTISWLHARTTLYQDFCEI